MEMILILIIFSTIQKLLLCQEGKGVCVISSESVTCCPGYHKENGTCILCQRGFYGKRCQTPCPVGFYGVGCRKECHCESHQMCNAAEGCVVNLTKYNKKFQFVYTSCDTSTKAHMTYTYGTYSRYKTKYLNICYPEVGLVQACNIHCDTACSNESLTNTCKESCNCTNDPMCNSIVECTYTGEVISTTDVGTFRVNKNTELTTDQDLLGTTQLNLEDRSTPWLYVTVASLSSLMLIVVLCSICFLVKHRNEKKRIRVEVENAVEDRAPEARLENIPQLSIVDHAAYVSDYEEICDVETAYAVSRELASEYNELAFYRSEARIHNFKSTNAIYDTAKNCSMQSQQVPNERRENSIDDFPCSVTSSFTDESKQTTTQKEVCTSCSEDESSV